MTNLHEDAQVDAETNRSCELITELHNEIADPAKIASQLFTLWVMLTRHLAVVGWTPDELAKEARHHASEQTREASTH